MTSAVRQRAVNVKPGGGEAVPGAAKVTAINHRPIIQETINTGDPERRRRREATCHRVVISRRGASETDILGVYSTVTVEHSPLL